MPLSTGQRARFFQLAHKAYELESDRIDGDIAAFDAWRKGIMKNVIGKVSIAEMNKTSNFDEVMMELAILAEDDWWISRLSSAVERRIRYVIEKQFLPDLEYLEKRPLDWSYCVSICSRMRIPSQIEDCPAELLVKVLQAIDSHIRRVAKRNLIELTELPSGYFRRGIKPAETQQKKHQKAVA